MIPGSFLGTLLPVNPISARRLAATAAPILAACGAATAVGDTTVSLVHVTQDENSGEPDYANLTIYDRGITDAGWADLTCFDHQPSPDFTLSVKQARSERRRQQSATETVKVRVDRLPPRHLASVPVTDLAPIDDRPATTITWDVTPRRGFLRELAGGKRLVAQIGDLPVLSLDVAAAKPDVVAFKAACDRMYANLTLPPQRSAKLLFENLDPFTDRGQIFLALFHETSHEGGNQVRFGVNCANDEHAHGVNLVAELPRALRPAGLPDAATSQLRLSLDARHVSDLAVGSTEGNPDRWTTFHLPPDRLAAQLPTRLAEAQTMTIRWFNVPALRFDLAVGRPEISRFASKCETMLRRPSAVRADGGT